MTKLQIILTVLGTSTVVVGGTATAVVATNNAHAHKDLAVMETVEQNEDATEENTEQEGDAPKTDEVNMYSDTPYVDCWSGWVQCDKDGNYLSEDYCISYTCHDMTDALTISSDYLGTLTEAQKNGKEAFQLDDEGLVWAQIGYFENGSDGFVCVNSDVLCDKLDSVIKTLNNNDLDYAFCFIQSNDCKNRMPQKGDFGLYIGFVTVYDEAFEWQPGDTCRYYHPIQWSKLDVYKYLKGLKTASANDSSSSSAKTESSNSKVDASGHDGGMASAYRGTIEGNFTTDVYCERKIYVDSNWNQVSNIYTPCGGIGDKTLEGISTDYLDTLTYAQRNGEVFKLNVGNYVYAVITTNEDDLNMNRADGLGRKAFEDYMDSLAASMGKNVSWYAVRFHIGTWSKDNSSYSSVPESETLFIGFLTNGYKRTADTDIGVMSLYELVDFRNASYYGYIGKETKAQSEAAAAQKAANEQYAVEHGMGYYDENGNYQSGYCAIQDGNGNWICMKTEEEWIAYQQQIEAERQQREAETHQGMYRHVDENGNEYWSSSPDENPYIPAP